jgi:hypothetical protein
MLEVDDLERVVGELRETGVRFRSDIVTGVGGKQILVEDPSGNPIEVFEPILPEASLERRPRSRARVAEACTRARKRICTHARAHARGRARHVDREPRCGGEPDEYREALPAQRGRRRVL